MANKDLTDAAKITVRNDLELFVKEIFVLEEQEARQDASFTFFADGYPGVVYMQSEKGFLLPRMKPLSPFFLYGQMIEPYELSISTPYLMIVFQLYPFAARLLFDVDPKRLNDDCADLSAIKGVMIDNPLEALARTSSIDQKTELIANFLSELAREKGTEEYPKIQRAIEMIQEHKGLITILALAKSLDLTERTLRRKFIRYVGIPPKKFAKIIQFQASLDQISTGGFSKLTDVVYDNGYADQSHFIRNIRKFTAKKPMQLKKMQ